MLAKATAEGVGRAGGTANLLKIENAGVETTPPEGDKETVRLLGAHITKLAGKMK